MPVQGDWRWLRRTAGSPWYPTLALFRPSRLGDRHAVIQSVETDLRRLAGP